MIILYIPVTADVEATQFVGVTGIGTKGLQVLLVESSASHSNTIEYSNSIKLIF